MNIFEVLHDAFKPFIDDKKIPLTILEVSNLWGFLAGTYNTLRNEEVAFNIVKDEELKQKLKDALENVHTPIMTDIEGFLRKEGVPLPNVTSEKPIGDYRYIPEGAKLTDEEIANLMSFNLLTGLTYGMRGLTESVRADVGLLFSKIIMRKITFSLTLKQLMMERGWIQIAPPFKE